MSESLLDMVKAEMRTCRNCRWWEACRDGDRGFCRTDPKMTNLSGIEIRQTSPYMWAQHSQVITRPDFGCNQFEKGSPVFRYPSTP